MKSFINNANDSLNWEIRISDLDFVQIEDSTLTSKSEKHVFAVSYS